METSKEDKQVLSIEPVVRHFNAVNAHHYMVDTV